LSGRELGKGQYIYNFYKLYELLFGGVTLPRLSKNQKMILKFLAIKPEMTTKEIAELVYGRPVEYKTKEYSSISRSLNTLEKKGLLKKVQIQLRWRLKT
jgi:DNA-binding MarR family transcriptional regulator